MFEVVASSVVRTKSAVANTAAAPSAGETAVRNGAVVSTDAADPLTERKFVVELVTVHGALPHSSPDSAVDAAVIVSFPVTVNVAPLASVSEVGFNKTCVVSVSKTVYGKTKQPFVTAA
jgi:hypothetical protein